MAIKSIFFGSGTGQFIELKLDTAKYTTAILTAVGGVLTPTSGSQVYPYRSTKAALATGALGRLKVTCKLGKKTRTVDLVCDKDKLDTVKGELVTEPPKTLAIGGFTKSAWTIEKVVSG